MGEEGLRKGNVRLQDGDLHRPHNQHIRLEDVGAGGNETLGRERSVGRKNMHTWGARQGQTRELGGRRAGADIVEWGGGCRAGAESPGMERGGEVWEALDLCMPGGT